MTSTLEIPNEDSLSSDEAVEIDARMLFVGPLPPPRTGTHVSFQLVCDEVRKRSRQGSLNVIDTSQKHQKSNTSIVSLANLRQCGKITREFLNRRKEADYVLVFGSNGFIFSMVPILRSLAGRRKFYVHICGGSFDLFLNKLNPVLRRVIIGALNRCAGVVVQTDYLQTHLAPALRCPVLASPNRRYLTQYQASPVGDQTPRLVYLSTVRQDKGIFVLLDALRALHASGSKLQCDIYGELWPQDEQAFLSQLKNTPNASYRGHVEPNNVAEVMSQYDVLTLPTFYQGEGHPGVLVESMMVGLPVVTTNFRAIPEVVVHGQNGLLVEPGDSESLRKALSQIELSPTLLANMSEQALHQRNKFDANRVLPEYLNLLGLLKPSQ